MFAQLYVYLGTARRKRRQQTNRIYRHRATSRLYRHPSPSPDRGISEFFSHFGDRLRRNRHRGRRTSHRKVGSLKTSYIQYLIPWPLSFRNDSVQVCLDGMKLDSDGFSPPR
jgi:hypothetical protein